MKKLVTGFGVLATLTAATVLGAHSAAAQDVYYKNCSEARAAAPPPS
ncbi:hypothetical protein [Nocardia sp. IFM 10818]